MICTTAVWDLRVSQNISIYRQAVFFDLFDDKDTIFFVDEPIHCIEKLGAVESEFRESMQGRLEKGYILPGQADVIYSSSYVMARLEQKRTVYLSLLDMLPKEIKVKDEANIAVQSLPSYNQHIEMLIEDIKSGGVKSSGYLYYQVQR